MLLNPFIRFKRLIRRHSHLRKLLGPVYGLHRNGVMRRARRREGIKPDLVVFSALDYRGYCDNPRYISEALHALRPETDIVWLFRDVEAARRKFSVPEYVRCETAVSDAGFAAMGRARVVVDNFNKNSYLRLHYPEQVYIQTWHGDRAFKKVGYDMNIVRGRMIEEHCSLGITGSDYGDMQFRSAFHYSGPLLKTGYPRNDLLVRGDANEAAAIRARLKLRADVRVLLYAPTFRDADRIHKRAQQIPLDLSRALDTLERVSGQKWLCLERAHYLANGFDRSLSDERIQNVSDYPEMADLLCIADALLTDYSSCAGDYALCRRPIYLYQSDLADYEANSRALYFDMKESPYWVAATPDALDGLIAQTTPERARENCDAILRFYGEAESGHAARSIAEYILACLDSPRAVRSFPGLLLPDQSPPPGSRWAKKHNGAAPQPKHSEEEIP